MFSHHFVIELLGVAVEMLFSPEAIHVAKQPGVLDHHRLHRLVVGQEGLQVQEAILFQGQLALHLLLLSLVVESVVYLVDL